MSEVESMTGVSSQFGTKGFGGQDYSGKNYLGVPTIQGYEGKIATTKNSIYFTTCMKAVLCLHNSVVGNLLIDNPGVFLDSHITCLASPA